jgi:iron complex outermembrane receptor protein
MTLALAFLLAFQDQDPAPRLEPVKRPQEKEVVIIGQRREGDVLDVPSALSVVTAEQLRTAGTTNLMEALRGVPGFFAQAQNKFSHDAIVDLRGYNNGGGNGQRVLVLVDGRKTNRVTSSSTDWASIPIDNIERVEVVRGPAAALYGDTAMAGVINIITKHSGGKDFRTAATAGGSDGTYRGSVNAGGAVDELLYDVYAGTEGTSGWRDHSDYRGTDVTGRVEAPLGGTLRVFAKFGYHEDTRERPGTLSKAEIAQFGREAALHTGSGKGDEGYVDAGLEQSLGDLGRLALFLNHTRGESLQRDLEFSFDGEDEYDISSLQLKHVFEPRLFSQAAVFTTGLDLSYERANSDSGSSFGEADSQYRRRLVGLFEHVELRPLAGVSLTASLRYDRALLDLDRDVGGAFPPSSEVDDQKAFDQLSPHAGVTVRVLDPLALYASWGRTFKYPTRDELVGSFAGDPQLDPERSHVYEIGARFWSGTWGSASVSCFRMEVKDEIFLDTSVGAPFGMNFNFEEVTHQGVETEGRLTPWEWLEVFATHAFTRAIVTESQNPLQEGKTYPVTPRLAGAAGIVLKVEGASLTLGGRYVGSRYLVNDVENLQDTLGSYWTFDTRVAYTWKSLTAFVSVYNLSDRETFDNGGLSLFSGTTRFAPAPERSWLIGGELRF